MASTKRKSATRTAVALLGTQTKSIQKIRHLHLAISGTPGTGKSTLAKQIGTLLEIPVIDLTSIIKKNEIYSRYDARVKTYDVAIPTLEKYLRTTLGNEQSYILDSHLSHHLSSRLVSHVIICTCNIKVLNKRLIARKYNKQKIQDNLQAEIFDVCAAEATEKGFPTRKIDCSGKRKLTKEKIRSHLHQLLLPQ